MALSLTRSVTFNARHHLRDRRLTEAENRSRFGDTVDDHEHAYTLSVTVSGAPDSVTGMLVDLRKLDRFLAERVIEPFEGKNLNEAVAAFAIGNKLATCEAFAALVFDDLASSLPGNLLLERVRVAEDNSLHADCTGPT